MSLRVLIVDDEERIREGMARQVESMGLELKVVALASDGEEALALVEKHVPDIVLMDINMPFMDGLECIRRMREKDPSCVIIIVSGYDRFEYAQRALKYGVDRYLLKPVEDDEFLATLKDAIQKHAERIKRFSSESVIAAKSNSPEKIIAYIKRHYADEDISEERLEEAFGMSRSALFRTVKGATGLGVSELIASLRIECAKALLLDPRRPSIKEICAAVGYGDQHYFSKAFKRASGLSPLAYREDHLAAQAQKDTNTKR
jgi:two-component system, response regulator YesN